MTIFVPQASEIQAAGNKPKIIKEFIGLVNSQTRELSIALMESPAGWIEPGQTPEFSEYTLVLDGALKVKTATDEFTVRPGQAVIMEPGEWVQYSSPQEPGAKYIAVCLPAFSPDTVHRDAQ